MPKMYYTIMLLLSMTMTSYAMNKNTQVNYIVYQKLNHGVPVTKIDFFIPGQDSDAPGKLIKTIYFDEDQTKKLMLLAKEEKETKAWRAWNAKWNAARL